MILLDTHTFIWLVSDPGQLSKRVRQYIQEEVDVVSISLVTAWEVALLNKRGRLKLPLPPDDFMRIAIEHHRINEIPLSRESILCSVQLPDLHNDPFDRILIAEAIRHQAPLLTRDRIIARYPGVVTVW